MRRAEDMNGAIALKESLSVFALLVLIFASGLSAQAASPDFVVAPDGNDKGPGTIARPFATIARAREAVRAKIAAGLTADVTVLLRGGTYRLAEPLVLGPEDSGSGAHSVTYAAYPKELPVLSGGRVISGWEAGADGIWSARVPGVEEGKWYFHQLFVNGERRTRARTPNEGFFHTAGKAPPETGGAAGEKDSRARTAFIYAPGSMKPWPDFEDINVVVFHSWETSRHRIAKIDEREQVVTFTGPAVWPFERWGPKQRYFVENAPDALDAPGEWYLDRNTGRVSYIPLPGEDMTKAEVIAPRLTRLLEVRGEAGLGAHVEKVTLRGLSFQHQDWTLPAQGHSDPQAAVSVPAAIMADGALNCSFERCEVAHVGGYGIWLRRGCKGSRIVHCRIHDVGAGGVRVGEAHMAADDADEATGNLVDNNHIYDGGHVYAAGVGPGCPSDGTGTTRRTVPTTM